MKGLVSLRGLVRNSSFLRNSRDLESYLMTPLCSMLGYLEPSSGAFWEVSFENLKAHFRVLLRVLDRLKQRQTISKKEPFQQKHQRQRDGFDQKSQKSPDDQELVLDRGPGWPVARLSKRDYIN